MLFAASAALVVLAMQPLLWMARRDYSLLVADFFVASDPGDLQSTVLTAETVAAPRAASELAYLAPAGGPLVVGLPVISCAALTGLDAFLCEPLHQAPTWSDVAVACATITPNTTAGRSLRRSAFVMRAMHWNALRVRAYGTLVTAASSSTFLVATTTLPWDALPAVGSPSLMLRHRLLASHAWYFDDRFDVLISSRAACAVSAALERVSALSPPPRLALANDPPPHLSDAGKDLVLDLLVQVGGAVEGIAGRGNLGASSFWTAVVGRAVPQRPGAAASATATSAATTTTTGTRFPLLLDALCGGESRGSKSGLAASSPGEATAAAGLRRRQLSPLCGRGWLPHDSMRAALASELRALVTAPTDVHLHNHDSVLVRLPALGPLFRRASPIFVGVATRNSSMLNAAFNPPETHTLAGSYLTAFNVVVTPAGALQSLPGTSYSARRGFHGLAYHTTCEGAEVDPMGSRSLGRLRAAVARERREAGGGSSDGGETDGDGDGSDAGGGVTRADVGGVVVETGGDGNDDGGNSTPTSPGVGVHLSPPHDSAVAHSSGIHPSPASFTWVDEVVVLTHRIEANIFHWTVETLGKLGPILDYVRAHPHVKLHVMELGDPHAGLFRKPHLSMLGLDWDSRIVTGYIRARVVHYPDNHGCRFPYGLWAILLRERYRAALGFDTPLREDAAGGREAAAAAAVAATSSISVAGAEGGAVLPSLYGNEQRRLADGAGSGEEGEEEEDVGASSATRPLHQPPPPPLVLPRHRWDKSVHKSIVLLRRRSTRKLSNEAEFNAALGRLLARSNTTLTVIDDSRMPPQDVVFRAVAGADLLIGAHGAGQTNAIVARPGACQVEIMPNMWLVPCYWRQAGHLGLRYHMLMSKGDRLAPMRVSVRTMMNAVRECLDDT